MILSILSNGWRWHDFTSCFFCLSDGFAQGNCYRQASKQASQQATTTKKEMMKLTYIHLLLELSVFAWLETILESVHNPSSIIISSFFAHALFLSLSACKLDGVVVVWCDAKWKVWKRTRFLMVMIILSMNFMITRLGRITNFLTQFKCNNTSKPPNGKWKVSAENRRGFRLISSCFFFVRHILERKEAKWFFFFHLLRTMLMRISNLNLLGRFSEN